MNQQKEMTLGQFQDEYNLLPNRLDDNASWQDEDGVGYLFETYGAELEFVRRQPIEHIWTYVDGDNGTLLLSGYHLVNRIGYLISLEPYHLGIDYTVVVSEDDKDN
jgi:hypothetical protein